MAVTPTKSRRRAELAARHTGAGIAPAGPTLAAICVALASTAVLASSLIRLAPRALEPVYGNVLPYWGFAHGLVASAALGAALGRSVWRRMAAQDAALDAAPSLDARTGRAVAAAFDAAAVFVAAAPPRLAYVFRWSDALGPVRGALATQCALAFPVLGLAGFVATVCALRLAHNPRSPARQAATAAACLGAVAVLVWIGQQRLAPPHGTCHGLLLSAAFAALSSVMVRLLVGHQERAEAARRRQAAPALAGRLLRWLRFVPTAVAVALALNTLYADPTCSGGLAARTTATADAAAAGYQMLYRNESVTGWVTVSDEAEREMRVLRSGHSLIGAHWKATSESPFAVFYYADAVRLATGRRAGSSQGRRGDGSERALQIGLGAGISARSLHESNVRVDVVEIDPAVHEAAVRFFGLPTTLNAVHLMDGRRFIDEAPAGTYDYIVHDVFTGGSVPAALFSQSAVAQMRRILRPDGILAMNYVGVPNDKRTLSHIVRTLRTAFASVRCFAETTDDLDDTGNMMFFAADAPVEFDITAEVLQRMGKYTIRSMTLAKMLGRELDLATMANAPDARPITDDWNPLPAWQFATAIRHWHVMRKLFPTEYWLKY
ncbi:hypothetical protein H4R18_005444 [Coemansia javaensis]|uniref:PABS domain-containing protein n=1 Tax=Coemansia javaensis TaxID=2761396 RepID=A0A9W8H6C3_9FUNG|nr:hypothetical protein H4R18_005444 [Coemansia javaensis]